MFFLFLVLMQALWNDLFHLIVYFAVAPKRCGFGETLQGDGGTESQDGGPGQRVCPPQPRQRQAGGGSGSLP